MEGEGIYLLDLCACEIPFRKRTNSPAGILYLIKLKVVVLVLVKPAPG